MGQAPTIPTMGPQQPQEPRKTTSRSRTRPRADEQNIAEDAFVERDREDAFVERDRLGRPIAERASRKSAKKCVSCGNPLADHEEKGRFLHEAKE